jgi:hypothetical protein
LSRNETQAYTGFVTPERRRNMARIPTASLILALCSAAALAQTRPAQTTPAQTSQPATSSWSSQTFAIEPSAANSCPVELKASLDTPARLVLVRGTQTDPQAHSQPKQFSRKLRVVLKNPASKAIVAARFSAHGYPTRLRLAPAAFIDSSQDPAAIRRIFSFNRTVAPGQQTSIELQLHEFGALTSIAMDSAIYADGSTWQPSGYNTCQATPNPRIETKANGNW